MANPKPHEQYRQMLKLMLSEENAKAIETIIQEVAREYKISLVTDSEKQNFAYGVTYKIVVLIAKLAKTQGLTNFWFGK
ncbi:MAG: hypothetical protein GX577_05635 [Leptolinea sp.]|nr:hypothetical protein [Leptolinea sp.]